MGITILKNAATINNSTSNITIPLRQFINLKVKADGTITTPSGEPCPRLNLGTRGEGSATVLCFDIQDLYWKGFIKNQNEIDDTKDILTFYQPVISALLPNGTVVDSIDFDGVNLKLSEDFTDQNGQIKLIYKLKNKDNTENFLFISSEFVGVIETTYDIDNIEESEDEYESENLKKPSIHLIFDENKELKLDTIGAQFLGYEGDRKVTNISVSGLTADLPISYSVFFIGNSVSRKIVLDDNNYGVVPSEITSTAGYYSIVVHAATENGELLISNPVKMQVIENWLDF